MSSKCKKGLDTNGEQDPVGFSGDSLFCCRRIIDNKPIKPKGTKNKNQRRKKNQKRNNRK